MNQKGLEFTGVEPIEDIQFVDFFGDDRLLDSSVIAAARLAGCASSESTCELVNPGRGDGGSSMMVAWPVAWASWLVLVVAVGVSVVGAVGAVVFLGGMVKDEKVSSRQVEVSVRIYCYMVICQRLMVELLSLMAVMLEGFGSNLCVAPFLNVCVPNLPQGVKDGVCQRWSELGWRCHTRVG